MKPGKRVILFAALSLAGLLVWQLLRVPSGGESDLGHAPPDAVGPKTAAVPNRIKGDASSPMSSTLTTTPWFESLDTAPQSIKAAIDPRLDYAGRLAAARSLPANLSTAEQQGLLAFLRERLPDDDDQPGHALKNDVMDALVRQESMDPQVIETMASVFRDFAQHVVIRDYAVQHLALAHERLLTEEQADPQVRDKMRSNIMELLWEGVDEVDSSISGTALMGLSRLSAMDKSIDQGRLRSKAVELAGNPQACVETRISALQVAGSLGATDILPTAVDIAAKDQSPVLRLSAIGTLGLLGGRSDLDLLDQIARQNNRMLRPAALAATGKINSRLNSIRDNPAGNP